MNIPDPRPAELPNLSWIEGMRLCLDEVRVDKSDNDELQHAIRMTLAENKAVVDDLICQLEVIQKTNRAQWKAVRKFRRGPLGSSNLDILAQALAIESSYADSEAAAVRGLLALVKLRTQIQRIDGLC